MNAVVQRHRGTVQLRLPLRTVSEPNRRDHWSGRAARAKEQRSFVCLVARPQLRGLPFPLRVLLVRVGPRQLDCDNLRGALKACRDGVADALGIDDRDPRVEWLYDQRRAGVDDTWTASGYGVEITIARLVRAAGGA